MKAKSFVHKSGQFSRDNVSNAIVLLDNEHCQHNCRRSDTAGDPYNNFLIPKNYRLWQLHFCRSNSLKPSCKGQLTGYLTQSGISIIKLLILIHSFKAESSCQRKPPTCGTIGKISLEEPSCRDCKISICISILSIYIYTYIRMSSSVSGIA